MTERRRRTGRSVTVLLLAAALAACGGAASGAAQRGSSTMMPPPAASTTGPTGTPAAPSTADWSAAAGPGPSVEPLTVLSPPDVDRGRLLEAMRIANQMPVVSAVDPALTVMQEPTRAIVKTFPENVGLFGPTQVDALQEVGGYQTGFIATRRNEAFDVSAALCVMEFATPEQAAAAAAVLPFDRNAVALPTEMSGVVATELVDDNGTTVSFAASSGQLLLFAHAWTAPGIDGQATAEKGIALLQEGMVGFRVSSPDGRLRLMNDPDGLASHTLVSPQAPEPVWLTGHGRLHLESDQDRSATMFANAGVDLVSDGGRALVLRAADGPRAALLQANALAMVSTEYDSTRIVLDGLPEEVACVHDAVEGLNCAGSHGRYAFLLAPSSEAEAVEIASRQLSLLVQLGS